MSAGIFYQRTFCLGAQHPCLPGHFPGSPVVPGVLLLQQVADALRHSRNLRLVGLPQVKYLQPWLPGRAVDLYLREDGSRLGFELKDGDVVLARGMVEAAP